MKKTKSIEQIKNKAQVKVLEVKQQMLVKGGFIIDDSIDGF